MGVLNAGIPKIKLQIEKKVSDKDFEKYSVVNSHTIFLCDYVKKV